MNKTPTGKWTYPTNIIVGAGSVKELPAICFDHKQNNWLLVTDPGLVELPLCQNLIKSLHHTGLKITCFSNIQSNPSKDNVTEGVLLFQQQQCRGVIALGGGSALDAAKAIALMSGQQGSLWDYEDIGNNWEKVNPEGVAPCIAIPTTAGTGSEVGRASVITDREAGVKRIIFHPRMLPRLVILDPELCVGLPKALTAATGMDALSHSLEAYCAKGYHPMADGIAVQAIRMIKDNLPLAYQDGTNLTARTEMLVASSMGATAFQKGLGAMHALAHPLGAMYNAHHGRLNAILMPYVLNANRSAIEEKIKTLAHSLNIANGFDGFLQWILSLRKLLGIEHRLSDIGIHDAHIAKLAQMATEDAAAGCNPMTFSPQDYQRILLAAIEGKIHD